MNLHKKNPYTRNTAVTKSVVSHETVSEFELMEKKMFSGLIGTKLGFWAQSETFGYHTKNTVSTVKHDDGSIFLTLCQQGGIPLSLSDETLFTR